VGAIIEEPAFTRPPGHRRRNLDELTADQSHAIDITGTIDAGLSIERVSLVVSLEQRGVGSALQGPMARRPRRWRLDSLRVTSSRAPVVAAEGESNSRPSVTGLCSPCPDHIVEA
jgi:hypothetical protein